MVDKKVVAGSVGGGILITLLSYFHNSTPQIVGAVWHGFPMTWIRYLLVGPQYNPWALDVVGLIVDIIAWSVVAYVVLIIVKNKIAKR